MKMHGDMDFGRTAAGPLTAPLARLRAREALAHPVPPAAPPGGIAAVGAKYDGDVWAVLLLRGGCALAQVSPAQARLLAADMVRIADAIEGRVP